MAREMERAGLIEELIGDAMDDVMGGDELESEADEEVRENKERKMRGRIIFYLGRRGKEWHFTYSDSPRKSFAGKQGAGGAYHGNV